MQAAVYDRYGPPDVVRIETVPQPRPRAGEIRVRVRAAGVTTADWRLRAAAFPGLLATIAGRLMFGICGPRKPILGSDFAGEVVEVGADVTKFRVGERVFGFSSGGAHAEYLTIKADGAVARTPEGLTDTQAAALPFGGAAAMEFLDRFARLRPGERVLIIGASGGVGAYAVQIAKALGAHVTGVASGKRRDFVTGLGADDFVDYRDTALSSLDGPFDVIFDTIGVTDYGGIAPMLAPGGRFLPLNFKLADAVQTGRAKRAGHEMILKVSGDSADLLQRLVDLVEAGKLRPVIDRAYPFQDIVAAYAHVETRHRAGAVVLSLPTG